MVTKGKLKMALVAEKGTDFKKLNQKKQQKAARKEKSTKGAGKRGDEDWESMDGVSGNEDGGVTLEDDGDSGSEDEVEEPMQVRYTSYHLSLPVAKLQIRLTSHALTKVIAIPLQAKMTRSKTRTMRISPCRI